jgi:hypothetical protein
MQWVAPAIRMQRLSCCTVRFPMQRGGSVDAGAALTDDRCIRWPAGLPGIPTDLDTVLSLLD